MLNPQALEQTRIVLGASSFFAGFFGGLFDVADAPDLPPLREDMIQLLWSELKD